MLRTFDFPVKGAANKSAQGIALEECIAVGVTRRQRGAGRGSRDPAELPDRQVSRAHRRPRFRRCSCLQSLLQNKETYRSGIWAGSGDPAPSAGAFQGGVQQTTAQHQNSRVGLVVRVPGRWVGSIETLARALVLARRAQQSDGHFFEFASPYFLINHTSDTWQPRPLPPRFGSAVQVSVNVPS
jgi:hypothetical protein